MNIKHLEAFIKVVELRNFTRAAEQLGTSQPAISFHIKALEEELGLVLLERHEKRVLLTEAGKILHPKIVEIIRHYQQLKQLAEAVKETRVGIINVGFCTAFGDYLLPYCYRAFRARYPHIQLLSQVGNSTSMARKLLDREVELVVTGPASDTYYHLVYTPLLEDQLICLAPSNSVWQENVWEIEKILDTTLIVREKGSCTRRVLEEWLQGKGLELKDFAGIIEMGSNHAILQAVTMGMGLGIISSLAYSDCQQHNLQPVRIRDFPPRYHLAIVTHKNINLSYSASLFIKFLQENKQLFVNPREE